MNDARTNGFGEFIKRRFIVGSYSLYKDNQEELFIKAQKIRRLIVDRVNEILKDNDVIYSPCSGRVKMPIDSSSIDKTTDEYLIIENHLGIANFAGLPSLTLPIALVDKFPMGANFTGKAFDEQNVLNIAFALESKLGLKNLSVKKVK